MIVDSISTMLIMGLNDEYIKARDWVASRNVVSGACSSLFETGIRILAGLISAYDLSGDEIFLKKAEDIGDSLIRNFDSNPITSIPNNHMCLGSHGEGLDHMSRMSDLKKKLIEKNDSSLYSKNPLFFTPTQPDDLRPNDNVVGGVYGSALLAELALCIEFVALSDRTGDPHYAFHSLRAMQGVVHASRSNVKLVPQSVNRDGSTFTTNFVTIGAGADSFYEYMIKEAMYVEPNEIRFFGPDKAKGLKTIEEHWVDMMNGFYSLKGVSPDGYVYIHGYPGQGTGWEHLSCFVGGNLAFGSFYLNKFNIPKKIKQESNGEERTEETTELLKAFVPPSLLSSSSSSSFVPLSLNSSSSSSSSSNDSISSSSSSSSFDHQLPNNHDSKRLISNDDLENLYDFGANITETCNAMYSTTQSGLSPESVNFGLKDFGKYVGGGQYLMRPEVVESIFYMYRITGDTKYQDYAWEIWKSIERHSRYFNNDEDMGFTSLVDIGTSTPRRLDDFPSFFMSETMKYLYLTFCDPAEVIPLDQYVFSTEAHPFVKRKFLKKIKTIDD